MRGQGGSKQADAILSKRIDIVVDDVLGLECDSSDVEANAMLAVRLVLFQPSLGTKA